MTKTNKPTAKELAISFTEKCREFGFSFKAMSTRIEISKTFPAGSGEEFTKAETYASILLDMIPMTTSGSVWGTDGGSIGGAIAIQNGAFKMNKSGCSIRVLNAIKKL
ncbi:hypothetical protein LMH73_020210 [Vibrio splendidus]|nr:hypothetical protein [Vibrio splendidus]MCC4882936.1 hypothetical protein [Vibrio splendidus]